MIDTFAEEHPYPILKLGPDGRVIYANPASLPVLLEWNTEVGQTAPAEIVGLLTSVVSDGVAQRVELQHGATWLQLLLAYDGKANVNVFGSDITQQRTFEKQLIDSRNAAQLYKDVLDRVAIVVITDARGVIRHANENFCRISEYSLEELIGNTHRLVRSGLMPEGFFSDLWKTIGSGNVWRGEICNRSKSGRIYWVDTTIVPVTAQDSREREYMAIRVDITSRKLAESALTQAYSRLAQAEQLGHFGSYQVGNGSFVHSEGLLDLLGLPRGASLEYADLIRAIHKDDLSTFESAVEFLLVSKEPFSLTFRALTPSGELRWFRNESRVLSSDPPVWMGTLQDITEKVQYESAMAAAMTRAEAATRAKAEFLANMSHEIRTPMNGVTGMCELLLRSELTPVQRQQIETVRSCGLSLVDLINSILDHSKLEAKKTEVERVPFQLQKGLDDVLMLMQVRATQKKVKLSLTVSPAVPLWLEGDPTRIKQILLNLISNGIKFTPAGGSVAVHVGASVDTAGQTEVLFQVVDTGTGIPKEAQSKLFTAFTQADVSTTRKYGGTGLGLAICKSLCELMGGKIGFHSVEGKGTAFFVSLPLAPCTPPAADASNRSDVIPIRPMRILVAEDNAVNQQVVLGLLEVLGQSGVDVVSDGAQAVAACKTNKYDLVLMDYHMPEMDGLEATRRIHAALSTDAPRIVALTASSMREDVDQCLAAGMQDFVAKPIQESELRRVLSFSGISKMSSSPIVLADFKKGIGLLPLEVRSRIIQEYLSTEPDRIEAIRTALQHGSAQELRKASHTFRGMVSNFHAKQAENLAAALENLGAHGELSEANTILEQLVVEAGRVRAALEKERVA